MIIKFFQPGKEFRLHKKEYVKNWIKVRESGNLIMKDELKVFEKNFAKFLGVKYAIGCNSGTDALFISLKALGIQPGKKVLVPSHTFVATAQVVAQVGAIPVLYDMDLEIAIDKETVGVIVAHIAGEINVRMEGIRDKCEELGLFLIEDACQSLGAVQGKKKAGSFGDTGCFSFYPAKILGGPGDGGMLVTNRKDIKEFAEEYRNHWKKDYSQWGINSRLDNVIASELNLKLKRLPKVIARRAEIAKMYLKGINDSYGLPKNRPGRVWQDFILGVGMGTRDLLYEYLKKKGIETMKNEYPFPIEKRYQSLHYESSTLRLPINEVITNKEVKYIIKSINEFQNNNSPSTH